MRIRKPVQVHENEKDEDEEQDEEELPRPYILIFPAYPVISRYPIALSPSAATGPSQ